MKALGVAASAFAVAMFAAPASPQKLTAIEKDLFDASGICLSASDGSRPEKTLSDCRSAIASLDQVRARHPNAAQPDVNLYLYLRGFVYTTIGHAIGEAGGGVRTKGACEAIETSWAALSSIVLAVSPLEDQEAFQDSRDRAAELVRLCRSEIGTPAGAPPLP